MQLFLIFILLKINILKKIVQPKYVLIISVLQLRNLSTLIFEKNGKTTEQKTKIERKAKETTLAR